MLTFIPWVLLVLQKIESSGLDGGGTLPGVCQFWWIFFKFSAFLASSVDLHCGRCVSISCVIFLLDKLRIFDTKLTLNLSSEMWVLSKSVHYFLHKIKRITKMFVRLKKVGIWKCLYSDSFFLHQEISQK